MDFKGKTVLITGASRGLGRTIARDFAKYGAKVIINYNKSYDKALGLKNEIDKEFEEAIIIKTDISNEEEVKAMFDEIKKEGLTLDVVVNNAGISIDNLIDLKSSEEFKTVLNINLLGTFLVSKYAREILNKGSSIINISSDNVIYGYPESIDYDASKAGIISLTKNFAKEYAPDVRVNCILPGWIDTEMNKDLDEKQIEDINEKTLLERFAKPEEISNVVLFLASDKSSYINGTSIVVNGGRND